jgi:preprotein translocase subunit SecA
VSVGDHAAYERREEEFGSEVMREVERRVVLSVLDRKWREHLYEMDYLREGIGLRGYGQRDPLIEYQREGYDMFSAMMDGIKEESVGNLFNLVVQVQENPIVEETAADGGAALGPLGSAPVAVPEVTPQAGRRGVPAQGTAGVRPGGAHARDGAPARAGDARSAQSEPVVAKRDGRVSGAQSARAQGGAVQGGAVQGGAQPGARRGNGAHTRPAAGQTTPIPAGLAPRRSQRLQYSAPSVDGGTHVDTSQGPGPEDDFARVGRNDPCPCGSGRKYKRCHGDPRNVT